MPRPAQYRSTGIDLESTSNAYHREYYRRYLSRPKLTGVDRRSLRESDWIASYRKQAIKSARNRGIRFDHSLTTEHLRALFEQQRGRCFYTGIRFTMERAFRGMRQASIDRLEPSRGYELGNVVWCLNAINYAKNDYPADAFLALIDDIRRHHPQKRT